MCVRVCVRVCACVRVSCARARVYIHVHVYYIYIRVAFVAPRLSYRGLRYTWPFYILLIIPAIPFTITAALYGCASVRVPGDKGTYFCG